MTKVAKKQFVVVEPLTFTGAQAKGFTYSADGNIKVGQIVEVPFGRRVSLGVVTKTGAKEPEFATKSISLVLDIHPLPPHMIDLAEWLEDYYLASTKTVWQTLLPAGIKRKRRVKPAAKSLTLPKQDQPLSEEQLAAYEKISKSKSTSFLVQGVTGSGKTRLYLELASDQIKDGNSVIVLVPEIALTPQLIAHFEASFPGLVVPYHSGMTEAEKHIAWQRVLDSDQPLVVLGPRSGLFLPLDNLGLIIIDECHESTYKQEQNPRYHAIPTAAKLASLTGAKLILGSATPSLNEVYLADAKRIELIKLTKRVSQHQLPNATIIDMKEKENTGSNHFISKPLLKALTETLASGRQSLLFLNRRGSASSHICNNCGHVSECPTCMLPLTFHADLMKLVCHICNYRTSPTAVCPECHYTDTKFLGSGTKRIESEIRSLLPNARVFRLDKDSADSRNMADIHEKLHKKEIDILIGTQMIAKGLDLPHLDTVGVLNADSMLHMPDFSAAERTFQLIAQVSGRAGRGDAPGRVYIQTRTPNHVAIQKAAKGDYWGFVETEMESRKMMSYPPYRYLLKLSISHKSAQKAKALADEQFNKLSGTSKIRLLGPAPAFYERAGGKYHWHIIVKSAERSRLLEIAKSVGTAWKTDLDPINLL